MRIVSRVLLAVLAWAAFSAASFAGGPFGIIRVGKWQGAAYTTDKGAFSFCVAPPNFRTAPGSSFSRMPIVLG